MPPVCTCSNTLRDGGKGSEKVSLDAQAQQCLGHTFCSVRYASSMALSRRHILSHVHRADTLLQVDCLVDADRVRIEEVVRDQDSVSSTPIGRPEEFRQKRV